jgi:ferredoxin
MRITLDRERCTGHGRCYVVAPDIFTADDDGYCVLRADAVAEDLEPAARRAVANCPEDAISIDQ